MILESWRRSLAAGVDIEAEDFVPTRVGETELRRRVEAAAPLVEISKPHLQWLSASLADAPHVAYVVDRDGVILEAIGADLDLEATGLAPGFIWSETIAGTNGAGTALEAGEPVAVVGDEHIVCAFRQFTCTAAPVHDENGVVIGAIDVSTAAEGADPGRLLDVAHAAFVITRELSHRAALSAAEAETRARDRLLAEVSHEARTPLTAILGWAQMLRIDSQALDTGLAEIEASAIRLSSVVADLLEMARISAGKVALVSSEIDLAAVTTNVVHSMRPVSARKEISLEIEADQPLRTFGDQKRLEQVVTNLVSNAIKFTPPRGEVMVRLKAINGTAELTVRDSGCGIDPNLLPHVFEYLRQGEHQERGAGLGLGLSIVRDIVRRHGGHVSAESDGPGTGALFRVEIPLVRPEGDVSGDRAD